MKTIVIWNNSAYWLICPGEFPLIENSTGKQFSPHYSEIDLVKALCASGYLTEPFNNQNIQTKLYE